jgi:ABC-2 type transport system ATP-binding protein
VEVLGEDPEHAGGAWRQRIGVVLQDTHPEPELTARECLSLYAGYYHDPRDPHDTLALVGLAEQADVRCEHLSGGQRRRLDVGLALIGDPELLFLDEPTTGFDPAARRAAWDVILGLRALGKTIVLTTHYMEEAERLADRIAVITAGRLVAIGTPRTLGAADLTATRITFTLPAGLEAADLPEALAQAEVDGRRVAHLRTTDAIPALYALAAWAIAHGHDLADLEVRRPTLEDVYLKLTAPPDEAAT